MHCCVCFNHYCTSICVIKLYQWQQEIQWNISGTRLIWKRHANELKFGEDDFYKDIMNSQEPFLSCGELHFLQDLSRNCIILAFSSYLFANIGYLTRKLIVPEKILQKNMLFGKIVQTSRLLKDCILLKDFFKKYIFGWIWQDSSQDEF